MKHTNIGQEIYSNKKQIKARQDEAILYFMIASMVIVFILASVIGVK
jgi:hypothetical protein